MKKDSSKYILMSFLYFIGIIASNLAILFEPIYEKIKYGKYNTFLFNLISALFLVIFLIIIKLVTYKVMHLKYEKSEQKELSMKRLALIYGLTLATIFFISAIIGFEIKILYDLGESFIGYDLIVLLSKLIYCGVVLVFVINMIENFQYGLEMLIPIKNEKLKTYLPLGGIATMICYGTYAWIIGFNTLAFLYFLLNSLYGFIYLLCNRSKKKSYIAMLLIYLF